MKSPLEPINYTYYRGRTALYAILDALGITKEDEVLTQAFTCVAVAEGIMAACAKPVYVDIEPTGFNIDVSDMKKKITKRTRAIIVQHTYGIPANMESILRVADQHKIPIVEDCCHTITSTLKGKIVGRFGVGSFYSFEWGKPLMIGIGGVAVLNDRELQNKIKEKFIKYNYPPLSKQLKLKIQYTAHRLVYRPFLYWPIRWLYRTMGNYGILESNYNPIIDGTKSKEYSFKMAPYMRRRLKRKISKLSEITENSIRITMRYKQEIISKRAIHPELSSMIKVVFVRYPLIVENKHSLLKLARKANIELADWYASPIHPLSWRDLSLVHYKRGLCPNAEKRCNEVVTLPTHSTVKRSDIDRAIRLFNKL